MKKKKTRSFNEIRYLRYFCIYHVYNTLFCKVTCLYYITHGVEESRKSFTKLEEGKLIKIVIQLLH